MKLTRLAIACAALPLVPMRSAHAESFALRGVDTLFDVVTGLLASPTCGGGSTGLSYAGGGSTAGENALVAQLAGTPGAAPQVVAPMVRGLSAAACGTTRAFPQAQLLGFDAVAMIGDPANACPSLAQAGDVLPVRELNGVTGLQPAGVISGTSYPFLSASTTPAWGDALRVLYAGLTHDSARDCASDVRHSLIRNWSSLFHGGCSTGTCSGGLRHAYRPGTGESSAADLFASLLGFTPLQWCNGNDLADADPLRTDCDPSDIVCQRCARLEDTATCPNALDRGLGVVLPVAVPHDATDAYTTRTCAAGTFRLASAGDLGGSTCPNGGAKLGTQCWFPVDSTGRFDCIASGLAWPVGTPTAVRLHGSPKVYNRTRRSADGTPLPGTRGWYRHANVGCAAANSADQAACLAQAVPCTVAAVGQRAWTSAAARAVLSVNEIDPADHKIQAFVEVPTGAYPLTRPILLSSLQGFAQIAGQSQFVNQNRLTGCLTNRAQLDPALRTARLTPLDATGARVPPLYSSSSSLVCR